MGILGMGQITCPCASRVRWGGPRPPRRRGRGAEERALCSSPATPTRPPRLPRRINPPPTSAGHPSHQTRGGPQGVSWRTAGGRAALTGSPAIKAAPPPASSPALHQELILPVYRRRLLYTASCAAAALGCVPDPLSSSTDRSSKVGGPGFDSSSLRPFALVRRASPRLLMTRAGVVGFSCR